MSAPKDSTDSGTNEKTDEHLGGGFQPAPPRFWKTFLERMTISVRLLGKEIRRKKITWLDLRQADYRLGEKAYSLGKSEAIRS